MAGKRPGKTRIWILLSLLLLATLIFAATALAEDEELLKILPGRWTLTDELQEPEGEPVMADLALLTLEENGNMSLECDGRDGGYAYTCKGTWSFEFVPGGLDRLTLTFTSTDDPTQGGNAYLVECVYEIYAESWTENDTEQTYLILADVACSGLSPFEDVYGYNDPALHREQGPNMRVIKCKDFVSLREKPSTSSKRLLKVPLGAMVLAYPEFGEKDGFILCVYHDEYGYILADYLEPVE